MKKTIKYTLLTFIFLIIIVSLFYIFISQYKTEKVEKDDSIIYVSSSTKEVVNLSIMTPEERKTLKVASTTNIRVMRRDSNGVPTDYQIIK